MRTPIYVRVQCRSDVSSRNYWTTVVDVFSTATVTIVTELKEMVDQISFNLIQ